MKTVRKNLLWLHFFANFGNGLIGIFLPFFIGQVFGLSFSEIILWGAAFQFSIGVLVYPINRLFKFISTRHRISLSFLFQSIFYGLLQIESGGVLALIGLTTLFIFQVSLFWPNYNVGALLSTDDTHRGKFSAELQMILVGVNIIAPITTGFLFEYGFENYSLIAAVICFLTAVYFAEHARFENVSASPWSKFIQFFRGKFRRSTLMGVVSDGIQSGTMWLIWPLYFKFVASSFALMGSLTALAAAVEVLIARFSGKNVDKKSTKKSLRLGIFMRLADFWTRGLFFWFPHPVILSVGLILGAVFGPIFQIPLYKRTAQIAETEESYQLDFFIGREIVLGIARAGFFILSALAVSVFGEIGLLISLVAAGVFSFGLWKY